MNFIKQLQAENAELKAQIEGAQQEIRDFRAYLCNSPKFTGVDADGSHKDWISTSDVLHQLNNFADVLRGVK